MLVGTTRDTKHNLVILETRRGKLNSPTHTHHNGDMLPPPLTQLNRSCAPRLSVSRPHQLRLDANKTNTYHASNTRPPPSTENPQLPLHLSFHVGASPSPSLHPLPRLNGRIESPAPPLGPAPRPPPPPPALPAPLRGLLQEAPPSPQAAPPWTA